MRQKENRARAQEIRLGSGRSRAGVAIHPTSNKFVSENAGKIGGVVAGGISNPSKGYVREYQHGSHLQIVPHKHRHLTILGGCRGDVGRVSSGLIAHIDVTCFTRQGEQTSHRGVDSSVNESSLGDGAVGGCSAANDSQKGGVVGDRVRPVVVGAGNV